MCNVKAVIVVYTIYSDLFQGFSTFQISENVRLGAKLYLKFENSGKIVISSVNDKSGMGGYLTSFVCTVHTSSPFTETSDCE